MKKTAVLFFLLSLQSFAQVIISPYIVLINGNNRFGKFIVQNESNQTYEVTISFLFGFPQSDSSGTMTMKYIDNPDTTDPSAVKWIKAFPRKFFLAPGQRQLIRMMVNPDRELSAGTYWARIVTSSAPTSVAVDTVKQGISAKIKFVLNQITTLLYRTGDIETKAELKNCFAEEDSGGTCVFAELERKGNSPFFGDAVVSVSNDSGRVIGEKTEGLSLYYNLTKKFYFEKLKPGNYSAEIKIIHNEKEVIPESTLKTGEPIIKRIQFTVN